MQTNPSNPAGLPVAIIGAGPVGLAAAAHVLAHGFSPLIFEAGDTVASHLEDYRHVRLFSPWRYNVDHQAAALLERAGWNMPEPDVLPTAGELVDTYLAPLARLAPIAAGLRFNHRVTAISREGLDKVKTNGRDNAAFIVRTQSVSGVKQHRAWAVLDATGTWGTPNPLGASGLPAEGEDQFAARIRYGMPDIHGHDRERYAGKRTLVVGAGHSAIGTLAALGDLANSHPGTQIVWVIRGDNLARIYGGGEADGLPARGALGIRLKRLVDSGRLEVHAKFRISELQSVTDGIDVVSDDQRVLAGIHEIVAATGSRPDVSIARELRVKLDPWLESTEALAPLIDPNVHSCGTVRPHGHRELEQPESRYYAIGAKSYGRAPNFLMATGYEQARSVVAALAGDFVAADDVQLDLPETGVCSSGFSAPQITKSCCKPVPVTVESVPAQTVPERSVATDGGRCGC